jgi:lipopolysaccharide biosynthesis regulator YciM
MAAGAAVESRAAEADAEASLSRKQEKKEDDVTATCKRKVDEIERRTRDDKDDVPEPEEELAIGKCYQTLGRVDDARKWLQRAAAHPKTKARAQKALRELAPE